MHKTALFVAKNGPQFEERIREAEHDNPKFAFLKPTDPFHAHYLAKVRELSVQSAAPPASDDAAAAAAPASAAASSALATTTTSAAPRMVPRVEPLEPPRPLFAVPKPLGVPPYHADVIQLTAQYVARHGRTFLASISRRERGNALFDFLKPMHHLFDYFTSLVEAYSKCIQLPDEVRAKYEGDARDPARVLRRTFQHAAFHRESEDAKEKESAEESERRFNLSIDWHDFVVVETISFDEAEPAAGDGGSEEATVAAAAADEVVSVPTTQAAVPERLVRKGYVPQVGAAKPAHDSLQYSIDPITRQRVSLDQVEEHMRISLLDPKWKEQKQIEAERRKDTNVAGGDAISQQLKSFAAQRTDIFGASQPEAPPPKKQRN